MQLNSIINRYLFIEMIPPFVINLVFFTFIFLMTRILEITNMVVNYGVALHQILLIMAFTAPYFLIYVIPMSVMLTILLTFLRMSAENEIIALRSSGISVLGLLPPVLLHCLIGCILTGIMSIYGLPWGKLAIKELTYQMATSNVDLGLKERTFNDRFEGVMLYVNKIDIQNKELIDVFISDERDEDIASTIIAPRGKLLSDPSKLIFQLILYNGIINQTDLKNHTANMINFNTYDVRLDLKKTLQPFRSPIKDRHEMWLSELWDFYLKADPAHPYYYRNRLEFHRKFAGSFSCFALGLLAVPLGMMSSSSRKSFGLALGLTFFLLYQMLLSAGKVFGEAGHMPAWLAMWMPNLIIGFLAVLFLRRTFLEKPIKLQKTMHQIRQWILSFKLNRCKSCKTDPPEEISNRH
jgi:lipopolysaccharide export system permease protein